MQAKSSVLLRAVVRAYRSGIIPARGYGRLFSETPARLWGGDDVVARTQVGDMAISLHDLGSRQLLVFGKIMHEQSETAFMRRLAPRLRSFYDVGANYGWYSRLVARCNPSATVTAIEANPNLMPYLRWNAPTARVLHAVASADKGPVEFNVAENSALSSAQRDVAGNGGSRVTVDRITLDDIIGDDPVDLIKCDVEGGEMDVLIGARQVRSRPDAPIWMLEADRRFLAEGGWTYTDLHDELRGYGKVGYYRASTSGRLERLSNGLEDLHNAQAVNVFVIRNSQIERYRDLF